MATYTTKQQKAVLDCLSERADSPVSAAAIVDALREQAVKEGILIKLNPDKLPGCYLHRTDPDDVARVEDRTFICCEKEEDAGPTNHWVEPKEMYEKMYALADGAYKGRTMYIIPYSMSIIGSPFAKYGFELTDSIYVVLNMHIMTRIGKAVCDALGDDEGFIKGLHCQCNLDKDNKYIVHFPQDNTIISMNSNYGGNVLQGKKCFALRIASNLGRQEGWMAEHMLILGIQNPRGEIKYISAAFPSAGAGSSGAGAPALSDAAFSSDFSETGSSSPSSTARS